MDHECSQVERLVNIEKLLADLVSKIGGVDRMSRVIDEHDTTIRGTVSTPGILGRINSLEANTLAMGAQMADLRAALTDMQETLRGSGQETGLISIVTNLVTAVSEWKDTIKWLTRTVYGWVIISLLIGLVATIGYFAKGS